MKINSYEGIIDLDTDIAKELGFTSDKFNIGYLWKKGDAIWISLIASLAAGNFSKIMKRIHELGFTIVVPSPLGNMREIVRAKGFIHSAEFVEDIGETVDVWTLAP